MDSRIDRSRGLQYGHAQSRWLTHSPRGVENATTTTDRSNWSRPLLGDDIFEMTRPYIVNIPPMVPHSFQNLDDQVAQLVVIFPTNVWEYDVLDYFPFADRESMVSR